MWLQHRDKGAGSYDKSQQALNNFQSDHDMPNNDDRFRMTNSAV